jgi:hypothetical protein
MTITPIGKKPIPIPAPIYLHLTILFLNVSIVGIIPRSKCLDKRGKDVTMKATRLMNIKIVGITMLSRHQEILKGQNTL